MWRSRFVCALLVLVALPTLAGCGTAGSSASRGLQVIAGENFWGSLAAQLGGQHVSVTSIVSNPSADPHEYESSTADARAFAEADYVIVNGAGYDDWASKLLRANPNPSRKVLVVADLLHKRTGDNAHFWYDPDAVRAVVDRISADYSSMDRPDASSYESLHESVAEALSPYYALIESIHNQFAGAPVAATESIFAYMAAALGLNLVSPPQFMQAISEGNDPPASSVATFQQQLDRGQVRLLVYNRQTVTAVTTNMSAIARQRGVPLVGISETVEPANLTFQQWQIKQLQAIQKALEAR